ncbi:BnaCnng22690D [Brassica napus]|uniref:BnaCnng22690D protein n=1 Tax=Brassica napus TaxID=3708 RepID=A0A078IT37_BRANA|nr:BnaCnng22690D [Brassica napus]
MYKRTDSPFIFQPNPKVFGGNLYLNSTPATKFYLDTNILAIEAFTNRMVGRTFLAPVAAGSWTNHGLNYTATNVYHPRSPQQMSGLFMLKYTLHPHHKRNKLQRLLA